MTKYILDENGFLVSQEHWMSVPEPTYIMSELQGGEVYTKCPICNVRIRQDRLKKHKTKIHPDKAITPLSIELIQQSQPIQAKLITESIQKRVMVTCPICNVHIRQDRLKKHTLKVHSKRRSPIANNGSSLIGGKLATEATATRVQNQLPQTEKPVDKGRTDDFVSTASTAVRHQSEDSPSNGPTVRSIPVPLDESKYLEQALHQSDNESIFADKYLGYMSREWDGKFGSLPLYDDYNDESGAD